VLVAADDGGALLGWAAVITAAGGFVGIVATAIAQLRKKNGNGKPSSVPPEATDPEHGALWLQMLGQLEAASVRADKAERRAEEAERELLAALRKAARR
jgi:hypothetical protein